MLDSVGTLQWSPQITEWNRSFQNAIFLGFSSIRVENILKYGSLVGNETTQLIRK
jgi:hypothetical protein